MPPRDKPTRKAPKGPRQISEIANAMLDPVLARRSGIDTLVIGSWDEIAGGDLADVTRPEKIAWPRHGGDVATGGGFVPGTLVVACEGAHALHLMHAKGELIQRLNAVFGFVAIDKIKIVQKPVTAAQPKRSAPLPLAGDRRRKLEDIIGGIDDPGLKAALRKLGHGVYGRKGK